MVKNSKKTDKKERVIIGLTGRLESTIAAFLLKKQGHDCIGVAVVFIDDEQDQETIKSNISLEPLEHISDICQFLEIPFYAVDAKEQFEAEVLSKVISARLEGIDYSTPVFTSELLLEVLAEKAKVLNATMIATGHFAKVHHNHATNENFLLASTVLEQDQSYMLSLTSEEILAKLELPLADIGKKEVFKIAELIREEIKIKSGEECGEALDESYVLKQLEAFAPNSLKIEGEIISLKSENSICSHEGVHLTRLGQFEVIGADGQKIDSKLQVLKINPSRGSVFVDVPSENLFSGCFVKGKGLPSTFNQSKPVKIMARYSTNGDLVEGTLYYKSQGHFILIFIKQVNDLFKGQSVVVYQQLSNSLKVITAGRVAEVNNYEFYDRIYANADTENEDTNKFLNLKSRYGYYF